MEHQVPVPGIFLIIIIFFIETILVFLVLLILTAPLLGVSRLIKEDIIK